MVAVAARVAEVEEEVSAEAAEALAAADLAADGKIIKFTRNGG